MRKSSLVIISALVSLMVTTGLAPVSASNAHDQRAPDVPPILKVPDGNRVHFHVFAIGVQIYRWTGTTWMFQAPEATLYDADGNVVGTHYAGPTWQSNSGSTVVGRPWKSSPGQNAILWLLINATSPAGPGILARTTFIQRVNTVGGLAPVESGTLDQVMSVDYKAEYFFYRAQN